jgi:hypothetical protein
MNYRILIFIIFIFGCKNNAEKLPTPELTDSILIECDSVSKKAETDYKNGIREYTMTGLVVATELEIHYSDFMKRNYNITMKANCVLTLLNQCYDQSMALQIEEEYGEDFIRLTREKAEIEFNQQQK